MVDASYITPKQLFWGLKFQVKEIIFTLFLLDEGDYKYTDGGYSNDIIVLHLDTAELITEIIQKMEKVGITLRQQESKRAEEQEKQKG